MGVIKNPQEYDAKIPTNVRLEEDLKKKAQEEADKKGGTLAEVINDALKKRYNKGDVNENN